MATGDLIASMASEDGMSVLMVCGPCSAIVGCCLYPWRSASEYPNTDLLATVTYDTDTLSRSGATFTGSTYKILDGASAWEVRKISDNSLLESLHCLVSGDVTDEFSDNYSDGGEGDLVRDSLCRWLSHNEFDPDGTRRINYFPKGLIIPGTTLTKPSWVYSVTVSGGVLTYLKDDPQSSPAGTYTLIDGSGPATVTIT